MRASADVNTAPTRAATPFGVRIPISLSGREICPFSDLGVEPHLSSTKMLLCRGPLPSRGPRLHMQALLKMYNVENHWSFESGPRNPKQAHRYRCPSASCRLSSSPLEIRKSTDSS